MNLSPDIGKGVMGAADPYSGNVCLVLSFMRLSEWNEEREKDGQEDKLNNW